MPEAGAGRGAQRLRRVLRRGHFMSPRDVTPTWVNWLGGHSFFTIAPRLRRGACRHIYRTRTDRHPDPHATPPTDVHETGDGPPAPAACHVGGGRDANHAPSHPASATHRESLARFLFVVTEALRLGA